MEKVTIGNVGFSDALKFAQEMGYTEWFNSSWHNIGATIAKRKAELDKAPPPWNKEHRSNYWYVPELHKIRHFVDGAMHGITLR